MVINNPCARILYGCSHLRIHGYFGWQKLMPLTAISIFVLSQNGKTFKSYVDTVTKMTTQLV